MLKKTITIDREKCAGCGLCVSACHQGAIGMVDGKAALLREDYCDGLGNCLPVCPTGAISFEEREVLSHQHSHSKDDLPCGCPGTNSRAIEREEPKPCKDATLAVTSQLAQWPVQIKLVPVNAPYFENAKLLVSADCAAYAYGNFHSEFMKGRITLIGCPKLDSGDYTEKLTAILKFNNVKSVTVARMEVPCCGGIENAVKDALKACEKMIQWQVVTISTDGKLVE